MHIPDPIMASLVVVVANNFQALIVRTVRVVKEHKAARATTKGTTIVAMAPVVVPVTVEVSALAPVPVAQTDDGEDERLIHAQLFQRRLQDEFGIDAQGHIRS